MIHILLVDDDTKFIENLRKELRDYFANKDYVYKIYVFNEYDDEFFKIANSQLENKLYLLDIETVKNNGIDVARQIRRYDRDSDILFLTAHDTEEYKNRIVTANIKSMGFIYKGHIKENFFKKIDEFLQNVHLQDIIVFQNGTSKHLFVTKDILYVTTSKPKRGTVIHTVSGSIEVSLPLHQVEEILFLKSKLFVKSHRAYTVNISRIMSLHPTNQSIIFSNHEEIQAISRKYRVNLLNTWNLYHHNVEELM